VKTALNHTVRSVHPDAALILLRQGERLVLKGLEPGDFLEPGAQMAIHRLGECLCGLAVREGKAIFSRDIHTDPRCIYEECKKADLCSFAAMPLRSAGEVIGILGVGSRPQRDFEEQAPFLEALTNEIAIGLKNAMLYEEAQTDAIELQTRLTQIQMAEREKQDLTKQLYQAQKMEAIGTLAGGIAHDFNNILAPIIIGAELALTTTPVDNQAHPMLQKVLSAGIRAKDLVQQILTFSRQSDVETSPLRLQPIIKETIKLARASLPATIEIRQDIRAENDLVLANPTQMHQVMMNLIANAGHAMRPKGGILEMTLNNMHLDDAAVAGLPEITAGHYVLLTVRDTGHGMERRTMEQIFNPFFTTKERGEGTGLGLSIVHGIVRGYGGAITVESQPGVGTTFTLYLPVTKTEVVEKTKAADPLPQGTESIMLVDDEPVIAEVYSQMLEQLGYKLDARTDPRDALAAFRSDPKAYDLVITDMTMPRMTGDKLAAELLRIRPDIPVILCTGFSEQITEQKALDMGIRDFIMKPIVTSNIAQKIRKALDREKAGEESNMSGEKAGL
jgi:signal transduction histidine kinase/ActR/RegA family two-component response regulator